LAYAHFLRSEFDEGERLLADAHPLAEEHGYLELRAWHWLGLAMRPWCAGDVARVRELTDLALTAARAVGEPTTEALSQCLIAGVEGAAGDPQAALARLQPTGARMIAAGAGMGLAMTESYLAPARAAIGEIERAREGLEMLVATGVDFGYLFSNAVVNLAD